MRSCVPCVGAYAVARWGVVGSALSHVEGSADGF